MSATCSRLHADIAQDDSSVMATQECFCRSGRPLRNRPFSISCQHYCDPVLWVLPFKARTSISQAYGTLQCVRAATVLRVGYGKVLTTGEGGVVLTNDRDIAELAILASQHPSRAFREIDSRERRWLANEMSLSSRLHPWAAAIGLAEVKRVPGLIARRRRKCEYLADLLEGVRGFVCIAGFDAWARVAC